jgi:hypothetical protein
MKWSGRNTLIALAAVALVAVVSVFGLYGYVNNLRNSGIEQEASLTAQYQTNQNELSAYVTSFYEQLGLANRKSAVLDTILVHAVQGRYGENGFSANGKMFSAIAEAYPDLTQNLNIFDDIAAHVRSGRTAFKNKQDQLIDRTRSYRTWQSKGLVQQFVISSLGFPSQRLEARVGGQVIARGSEALEKMQDIVLTEGAVQAFQTGRQEPLRASP